MTFFRIVRTAALAWMCTFAGLAQDLPKLLKSASGAAARTARTRGVPARMELKRQRLVEVDRSAIVDGVDGQRRLMLELFDDARFEVDEIQGKWTDDGGTYTWAGKIRGMERGQIVLAATGDIVSANVTTDDNRFFWIRQVEGKLHEVQEVAAVSRPNRKNDAVRVPDLGEPEAEDPAAKNRTPERLATRERGATSFIDILVAYTPAAKNAAGGAQAMLNKIQLAIVETNMAHLNSKIDILLHLVGTTEVTYDESVGIDKTLDDLKGTSDGQLDNLHTQRNQLGADLVALVIADVPANGDTAGLAFMMQQVNSAFASWAFSVSVVDYLVGPDYTFAHEVGHNMGNEHDRANAAGQGAYPYSYGFQNLTGGTFFRTIMAYECSGLQCPHINYYSNPTVSYQGSATGASSAAANAADNAQSMNNTAPVVALFRPSAGACLYSLNPTSTSIAAAGGGGNFAVTAGGGCAWNALPSQGWVSIPSGASGNGNGTVTYAVQANNGAPRTATVSVAGQTFTINQAAGGNCTYSLNPGSASYAPAGGQGSITVTAGAGCAWTASTGDGWIAVTGGASGTGNGTVTYTVSNNLGGARNGTISAAGIGFSVSQSANTGVTQTITSNPPGLNVTVDGVVYTTPQQINWEPGSSHTLSAATQGSGTRHVFLNWSNGGAATQSVTGPASSTTYTASFQKQYLLTSGTAPANGGALALVPGSADGYYNSGATVQATATPNAGFTFTGWTGAVLGILNPAILTMDAQKSLTAGFTSSSGGVTITSNPTGRTVIVDGVQITTPQVFQWEMGSFHSVDTIAFQTGNGAKYTFTNWSDGGPQSHPITIFPGLTNFTANFATTFQLTTTGLPQGSGIVSATPVSADGYYASGATVQLAAAPLQGYQFVNWTGDAAGSNANTSVLMIAPRTVTGNFTAAAACSYALSQTSGSVLATGDLRSVAVTTGASCGWSAVSNAAWITVLSGSPGTGSGAVRFSVAVNPNAAPRTGTMTIGGVTFTVTQSAKDCTFTLTLNASLLALPYNGASYPVAIATQNGCAWTGTSSPSWITLSAAAGTGSGTVNMVLTENTGGAPRLGSISIGGQHLQVLQKSPTLGVLFTDVPAAHDFFDHIGVLRLNNITPGCGANTYCPEAPMLRTEMAAFIIRALFGESFTYPTAAYFTDVPANHAYFKYVQKLREQGITVGCTDTTYCPNDAVTRGQMAAFLMRARLGVTQGTPFPYALTPYFTDVPVTDVFFPYVQKMKELGITSGCQLTVYCNADQNTRGQMAAFVNRALGR